MRANTNSSLSTMAHPHRLARIVDVHFHSMLPKMDRGILIEHDQNSLYWIAQPLSLFGDLSQSVQSLRKRPRKSLILKRRDVRVVEGARLESEACEAH